MLAIAKNSSSRSGRPGSIGANAPVEGSGESGGVGTRSSDNSPSDCSGTDWLAASASASARSMSWIPAIVFPRLGKKLVGRENLFRVGKYTFNERRNL